MGMLKIVTAMAAVLCLAGGVLAVAEWRRGIRAATTRRRLSELAGARELPATSPALAARLRDIDSLLPRWLVRRLFQAGIAVNGARASSALIGLSLVWIFLAVALGPAAATVIAVTLVAVAFGVVDYMATRRMDALAAATAGFFDRLRQLLIVGNSLSVALARATQSSPPIVVEFYSPTVRRIANGAGVAESVNQLADDLDLHEVRLLGTAIETNLRFGGSLTAVLANLIENIHRRAVVDREVRANTSQIRASAWTLGLLPLVASALVMMTNPEYMEYFIREPAGHRMLIYAAISEAIGILLMRSIVRVTY